MSSVIRPGLRVGHFEHPPWLNVLWKASPPLHRNSGPQLRVRVQDAIHVRLAIEIRNVALRCRTDLRASLI